ncbi:MAG: hypothetical protein ABI376_07460 [Caulobacteraceae bacterium]
MADEKTPPRNDGSQPGVMGDQTEEQNLGQPGNPKARITEDEVREAFGKADPKKTPPKR